MILSDVYSRFLNRAILPLLLPLTRSRFPSWARRISERQFWPAADQRAHQLRQLRPLLAHAAAHVPFYRDRIAAAGLIPGAITELEELTRIAMCKKNDILSNFPDRMVAENLRTGDWQYVGTGGTTNRVTVIHDFRKRDMSRAAAAVVMAEDTRYRLGKRQVAIPPDACSAVCGVEGFRQRPVLQYLFDLVHNGSLRDAESISNLRGLVMNNWIERAQVLDPFGPSGTHIDDARLAEYIEAIRQRRPTMLMALPQYLQALSRYVRRTGDAPPRVPVVRPMGALMPPFVKQQVQDALALEVREHYGSRELGGVAFDCRFRQGLHVLTDLFIVEVVDGNGRPVADGELGTVLVTDLHNRAMPMIRYQIGDIARVSHAACPCGRSSPRITIEGRLEDTFVTPGGKFLTPLAVCEFFYAQPGIEQFQLLEHASKWELRYVPLDSGPDDTDVAAAFAAFSGDKRPMKMRRVSSILPESSGKFRHTKSISFELFFGSRSTAVRREPASGEGA